MVEMNNPIVLAMCLTMRHDWGLDKHDEMSSGMTDDERHFLYAEMHQVYFNDIKPILDKLESEVDVLTDEVERLKTELRFEQDKVATYQSRGQFY
jgi:hypothetical protein